ncbi:PaaI family thioesterase [Phenylobacterium sp.]|uniref:PaaI family thioesterase n=1 Tax=Phenylobacterium sp. TaxID=1871053 RepID=UPI0008BDD96D|nr:MAG: thioesterase [Phenylobacterium sp. RIFCSPHIGHO2_01_FULL_70_10]
MQTDIAPPDGFVPHDRRSPLTEPWEPIFVRRTEEAVILGLQARPAHANGRGFVHGGLLMALADNAMGLTCAHRVGGDRSLVTVNLSLDFLAAAQIGQWLAFETTFVKPGSTLCFAQAFVTADGHPCARANGVFRVVSRG